MLKSAIDLIPHEDGPNAPHSLGYLIRRVLTGGLFMYAIIETGGKQYRAEKGKTIRVEKLSAEKGDKVNFDRVLMFNNGKETQVGKPYLDNCKVEGKVVGLGRSKKITVFKFKRKKNYRRKQGHRQPYTDVLINKVSG